MTVRSRTTPANPATRNAAGMARRIDTPVYPGINCCITYVVYAPSIISSPCAMLMTPITPNVMARPIATSTSTDPRLKPKKSISMPA